MASKFRESLETYAGIEQHLFDLKRAVVQDNRLNAALALTTLLLASKLAVKAIENSEDLTEEECEQLVSDFKDLQETAFKIYSTYKAKVA